MSDQGLGGAWGAPIFDADVPVTAESLLAECDKALVLLNPDPPWADDWAASALFKRWSQSMRAIGGAADPVPYPDWLSRRRDMHPSLVSSASAFGSVVSVNYEDLQQSIEDVRNWCKARALDGLVNKGIAPAEPQAIAQRPPDVQDGGGPRPATEPFYARPDESGVRAALESAFRVFQCIAPKSWIDAPALVAFVMGNKGKVTTAEAMWAIHDIESAGGLIVHVNEQAPRSLNLVTLMNPPAGIQMATGVLHVDLEEPAWSGLDFEPNHRKIEEFRRSLVLVGNTADRADRSPLFPKGVPDDSDLVDLVTRIDAQKNSGKSRNAIARELLGESNENVRKWQSLLRQIRRMENDGRVKF